MTTLSLNELLQQHAWMCKCLPNTMHRRRTGKTTRVISNLLLILTQNPDIDFILEGFPGKRATDEVKKGLQLLIHASGLKTFQRSLDIVDRIHLRCANPSYVNNIYRPRQTVCLTEENLICGCVSSPMGRFLMSQLDLVCPVKDVAFIIFNYACIQVQGEVHVCAWFPDFDSQTKFIC